ncbi:LysE family translocator [Curvivirga sp.]|uniref:LysE family translocator n=1 Tax=Curvivirga sp. TaxID=2856848 RepID=UPI003B5AA23C
MLLIFIKSILVGLSIAAIVGPISILVIRTGLTKGMKTAFISGMGAAVADAAYGIIAAFGLLTLDNLTSTYKIGGFGFDFWAPLLGCLFMLYLGIKILRHPPEDAKLEETSHKEKAKGFLTIFLLTISNPLTIISFIAIFAGLGITTGESGAEKILVVFGVFLGSALWWVILSFLTGYLRRYFNSIWLLWANRVSAIVLLSISTSIIYSLVHAYLAI